MRLPVVKVSHLFRKGELGCPYAARNFFELDPHQRDDSFGNAYGDLEAQFLLLVRSAHRLGMRVMLDVAKTLKTSKGGAELPYGRYTHEINPREPRTLPPVTPPPK